MHIFNLRLALVASSLLAAPILVASPAFAQAAPVPDASDAPFLHALFSDNAVLQRDRPIPVWGWTAPGKKVTVKLDAKAVTATADAAGRWMVRIGPYPAGGPHTLVVTGGSPTENVTRQNVMFGDVWLCSGQSNMEWGVKDINNSQQEIAAANFPQIRLFMVPKRISLTPQAGIDSQWLVCSPENIVKSNGNDLGFSAVGYFFGRKLNQELGIPIGLIQSARGGTIAEAWISESALSTMPDFKDQLAARKDFLANPNLSIGDRQDAWLKDNDPAFESDWSAKIGTEARWKTAILPSYWDVAGTPDLTKFDGIGLFRREVAVPEAWAGKDLTLNLGAIDDFDTTYWNGKVIGSGAGANLPRKYIIPGAFVKAGSNVVAVRVTDTGGPGGIWGPASTLRLSLDVVNNVSLDGAWQYKVSLPVAKLASMPMEEDTANPNRIDVLYNGMIAPLEPYGLKGAIWYQGESNSALPEQYSRLLPTLIGDWRKRFDTPLPFYIVQLAGYKAPDAEPRDEVSGEDWPGLRAAQQKAAATVPKTGIAVTTDIGNAGDIHPRNKQDVGLRLALIALAKDYGKTVEFTGPVLKTAKVKDSQIELTFDHAEGGLSLKGEVSNVFAIAGPDRLWSWATPQINGAKVTLSNPAVPKPVYVRYAWSNYPRANLYNGAQLPAPPFHLDLTPGQ